MKPETGEAHMVNAIILLNVKRSLINETAETLAAIQGVSEVFSVSGEFDLVAVLRVPTNDALSELVTNRLLKLDAILKTTTMLAFRAYSKHDLEAMFSIDN
jgi:DNA-binding Lrp family transcriptional regulator